MDAAGAGVEADAAGTGVDGATGAGVSFFWTGAGLVTGGEGGFEGGGGGGGVEEPKPKNFFIAI